MLPRTDVINRLFGRLRQKEAELYRACAITPWGDTEALDLVRLRAEVASIKTRLEHARRNEL